MKADVGRFECYDNLTTRAQIDEVLRDFIERVREGRVVHPQMLQFIAAGIERHLAGADRPWPARRGVRRTPIERKLIAAWPLIHEFHRLRAARWEEERQAGKRPTWGDAVRDQLIEDTAENNGASSYKVATALDVFESAARDPAMRFLADCVAWTPPPEKD
jgi:hypothetical protein